MTDSYTFTVEEAAVMTNRSPQMIRRWVREGVIPAERLDSNRDRKAIRLSADALVKIALMPYRDANGKMHYVSPTEIRLTRESTGETMRRRIVRHDPTE